MAVPSTANSRVRRKLRARNEWMTFRTVTAKACAVTTWDNRESKPPTRGLLPCSLPATLGRCSWLASRDTSWPLLSRGAGYQKRHRAPVPLVGLTVGHAQPVLLVHRTQNHVSAHERREDGSVRRHARQE